MRQMTFSQNPRYLIIGGGRVARHFEHYFTLLNLPTKTWARKQNAESDLKRSFDESDVTLLLVTDGAVEELIEQHPFLSHKPVVHFSGSLFSAHAFGAHPLSTFAPGRYDLDTYRRTYFICDDGPYRFDQLFPQLPNPHLVLSPEKKRLYHALCVMSGNFTVALWQKAMEDFEQRLGLKREALIPYLKRVSDNLQIDHRHALTGPIVREDIATIKSNLESLAGDPFQQVYLAFLNALAPQLSTKEVK